MWLFNPLLNILLDRLREALAQLSPDAAPWWFSAISGGSALTVLSWLTWAWLTKKIAIRSDVDDEKADGSKSLDTLRADYEARLTATEASWQARMDEMRKQYEARLVATEKERDRRQGIIDDLIESLNTLGETLDPALKLAATRNQKRSGDERGQQRGGGYG